MNKVEELIINSHRTFRKNGGMFKTVYRIDELHLKIEVYNEHFTIEQRGEYYSSIINKTSLAYLENILKNV